MTIDREHRIDLMGSSIVLGEENSDLSLLKFGQTRHYSARKTVGRDGYLNNEALWELIDPQ